MGGVLIVVIYVAASIGANWANKKAHKVEKEATEREDHDKAIRHQIMLTHID